MFTKASVLNAITNNGGDVSVVDGMINIAGLNSIPITGLRAMAQAGIVKIPAVAEQIQKTRLTFTSSNSADYSFLIAGYSIQFGTTKIVPITWTSTASNTTALTSAAIAALISAQTDFTVTATDTGSGVVDLAGHATIYLANGTPAFGPIFSVSNTDTKLTITAPLTVTFLAAPTGGRTATGYVVVPDNGTLTTGIAGSVKVLDGGEGYLTAPTFTFAGSGEGSGAAATAYLFEGKVIDVDTTAGSGYLNRIGLLPVGTPAAIKNKYGYIAAGVNNPGNPSLAGLASLTDGNTYTEWDFNYAEPMIGGNTTVSKTTATKQQALFVYEGYSTVTTTGSCANLLTLNSFWGVLANLQQGYKVNILDSGASNVVDSLTVATGAILLAAGGSPALGAVSFGMKPGDTIVVGTALVKNTDGSGVFSTVLYTTNLAGFVEFTRSTLTIDMAANTVYKLVQKVPLA